MFWLSICQTSNALDPITSNRRPWATVEKFWQFCQFYGDYQATPPSRRRQFIFYTEQARIRQRACGELEPCSDLR